MKIAFPCPHCGAKLAVDESFAGRTGRCHKCQRRMVVPAKGDLPVIAPRGGGAGGPVAGSVPGRASTTAARPATDAIYRLQSLEETRPGPAAPSATPVASGPLPVAAPPDPFAVPEEDEFVVTRGGPMAPVAPPTAPDEALRAYRNFFGLLVRCSTWIAETSYTVSFLLLILAIASGMVGSHAVASLCVAAIVIFNVVGLVGDLAALVTLSFRKNPMQGALFLVPPFTFWYLWTDWPRYREAAGRLRIPLVMLAVVAAAHLTVHWLGGGNEAAREIGAGVDRAIGRAEEAAARGGDATGPARGLIHEAREWVRRSLRGPDAAGGDDAADRPAVEPAGGTGG